MALTLLPVEHDDRRPLGRRDRVATLMFDPLDADQVTLFSDAAAGQLVLVLRGLLARLEAGTLRMPLDGGVRWVEVDEA